MGFDLRRLSLTDRELFWRAAERVYANYSQTGGENWNMPDYYPGFLKKLENLLEMKKSIEEGKSPELLNDFDQTVDFDGKMINYDEFSD